MDEFINLGDGTPAPDFAALAPAIHELADAGDAVAVGVLQQAANDLVGFVLLVRAKLRRKHGIAGEIPVAWTGSVIAKMDLVRQQFFSGLHAAAPGMPVGSDEVVALKGAIWRAERMAKAAS
jgi:N-acetylglucosamine kinase-like BadF-type ATPase